MGVIVGDTVSCHIFPSSLVVFSKSLQLAHTQLAAANPIMFCSLFLLFLTKKQHVFFFEAHLWHPKPYRLPP